MFTYSDETYETPNEACAAVNLKAWAYDSDKKEYVLYDGNNPRLHQFRAECAPNN